MPVRVVLYEDHPDLRESLSLLLRGAAGIELLGAFATPVDVLTHLRTLRPDVVLLDVMMPGVDGWAVLEQLKRHLDDRIASVKVLMKVRLQTLTLLSSLILVHCQ